MSSNIIFGGKGFRWKGRSLKPTQYAGFTCISLPRKDSIIMTPCVVKSGETYKVTITAANGNGNGIVLVNFFGGMNYDGPQIPIEISSNDLREYSIDVPTPVAPENTVIYFRVWRPATATGNVVVKQISFSITEEENIQNVITLWQQRSGIKSISQKLGGGKKRNIIKRPLEQAASKKYTIEDVEKEIYKLAKPGVEKADLSFVTCVCNIEEYKSLVIDSLAKNKTNKSFDLIPIYNFENKYSAAQALNIGIEKAKSDLVVLCHQDIGFPESWINILYERIEQIEKTTKDWGIIGPSGISPRDEKFGIILNNRKDIIWMHGKKERGIVQAQTIDECCMIFKKSSGLKFDEILDGFHFYGADFSLEAISKGLKNFGIWIPTVHEFIGRSLASGKDEYIRQLDIFTEKWKDRFDIIRTDTAIIENGKATTFFTDAIFTHLVKRNSNFKTVKE